MKYYFILATVLAGSYAQWMGECGKKSTLFETEVIVLTSPITVPAVLLGMTFGLVHKADSQCP